MELSELKALFGGMDEFGKTPVYLQLREKFSKYIDSRPHNSLFPSERELSEALGIHRLTISKALAPFVEAGRLLRGTKGTIISKEADDFDSMLSERHPLNFSPSFHMAQKSVIRLALVEDYPGQKAFWKKTVESFNQGNSSSKVEMSWLPKSVSTPELCREFLKNGGADIMQFPGVSKWFLGKMRGALATLPEDVTSEIKGEKYWTLDLLENHKELLDIMAPTSFAARVFVWNEKILEKHGIAAPSGMTRHEEMAGCMAEAGRRLGRDILPARHIEDLFTLEPYPAGGSAGEVEEFLRGMFAKAAKIGNSGWFESPPNTVYNVFESMRMFVEGRTAFSGALLLDLANLSATRNINFKGALSTTGGRPGRFISAASVLVVNAASPRRDKCRDFIRHVVSEKTQRMVPEIMKTCSIMKTCNSSLLDIIKTDRKSLDESIKSFRQAGALERGLGELQWKAREELFPSLIKGEMSVDEALEKIMSHYKETAHEE